MIKTKIDDDKCCSGLGDVRAHSDDFPSEQNPEAARVKPIIRQRNRNEWKISTNEW